MNIFCPFESIFKSFFRFDNFSITLDAKNGFPVFSEWDTCRNWVHVGMGYMSEWGICWHGVHVGMWYMYRIQYEVFGCLLVEQG